MNKNLITALIFIFTATISFTAPGLKWATEIGHSFKSPAITADKKFAVVATDEGQVIWVNITDGTNSLTDKKLPIIESKYATAFRATPLITSKNDIYAPNTDGRLYIRDENGKLVVLPSGASWGPMLATPTEIILKDKRRILCPSMDGNIYAVNPDDKSWVVWYAAGAGIESGLTVGNYTPVINLTIAQKADAGSIEITVNDVAGIYPGDELRLDDKFVGFVKSINEKTIQFNDKIPNDLNVGDVLATYPHLLVYFGSNTGRVYAMNGDLEKSNLRWVFPDVSTRVSSFISPMALNGDKLYAVNRAGNIYCFIASTGKVITGPIISDTETGTFVNVCLLKDTPLFSTDNGTIWQLKDNNGKQELAKFYGDSKAVTQFSTADKVYLTDMTGGAFAINSDLTTAWKYNYDFGKLLSVTLCGENTIATTADGKIICIAEDGNFKTTPGGSIAIRPGFTAPGTLPDGGARWSSAFTGPQSYSPVVAMMADTVRKTRLAKAITAETRYIPVQDAANIYVGDYISIGSEDLGPVLEVTRDKGNQQIFVRDATTHDYPIDTEIGTLLYRRAKLTGGKMIEYKPVINSDDRTKHEVWTMPVDAFFPRDNFTMNVSMDISQYDKAETEVGLYLDVTDNDKRGFLVIPFCVESSSRNGTSIKLDCKNLRANYIGDKFGLGLNKNRYEFWIESHNGVITAWVINNEKELMKLCELGTDYKAPARRWNIFANVTNVKVETNVQPIINIKWYPGVVISKKLMVTPNSSIFTVDHGERLLGGDTIQLTQSVSGSSDLLKILKVDGNEVTLDADSRARYDYTVGDIAWVGTPAQWAVFTAGDDGVVRAADADTGRLLWKNDLRGEMGAVRVPVLVNSRLNRIYAASLSGRIFAFSQNGLFCWAYPDFNTKPAAPFSTPMIMDASNSVVAVDDAGVVYRVNADGILDWKLNTDAGKPVKLSIFRWNETWRITLVTENKLILISPLGEILKNIDIGKVVTAYSDDKLYILTDNGILKSYADFDTLKDETIVTDLPKNISQIVPMANGWLTVADKELVYADKNGKKKFVLDEKINAVAVDNLGRIIVASGNDVVLLPETGKWGDGKILWRKKLLSRITGLSLWYSTVIATTEDGRMISLGAPRFDEKTENIIPPVSTDYNLKLLPGPAQPTLTDMPEFNNDLLTDIVEDSNGIEFLNKKIAMPKIDGFMINPTVISAVIAVDVPVGNNEIPVQSVNNFYVGDKVIFTRQNGADSSGYTENYVITEIVNTPGEKRVVKLNKSIEKSRAAGDVMVLYLPDKYTFTKGAILPGQKLVLSDQEGAKFAFGPNGMTDNGHFLLAKKKTYPINKNADIILTRNNFPELTENLKIKITDAEKTIDASIKDIIINKGYKGISVEKKVKGGDKIYAVILSPVGNITVGDFIVSDSFAGEIINLNKINDDIFAVMAPRTCAWSEVKTDKVKIINISSNISIENIDNGVEKWNFNSSAIGLNGKVLNMSANYYQSEIGSGRFNDMRLYGITENAELFALNIVGELKWQYNLPLTGKGLNVIFNNDKSIAYVVVSGKEKSMFYAVKLTGVDDEKRIIVNSEIDGSFEKIEKDGDNIKLIGKKTSAIINPTNGKVVMNVDGVKQIEDTRQISIEKKNDDVTYILNNDGIDSVIGISEWSEVKYNQGKFEKLCTENRNIWKISNFKNDNKVIEISCSSVALLICKYADKIRVYKINNDSNLTDTVFSHPDNYYLSGLTNPSGIYDKLADNFYESVTKKLYIFNGKTFTDINNDEKITLSAGKYSQALSGIYIDTNNNGQWDYFEPIKKDETAEFEVDKHAMVSRYPNVANYVLGNFDYTEDNSNFKMNRIGNSRDIAFDKNSNVDAPVGLYNASAKSIDNNISSKMQANKLIAEQYISDCKMDANFVAEVKKWRNYLDGAERNPTTMDINENDTVVIVSSDTAMNGVKAEENKVDTQLWIRHLKSIMATSVEDIKAGDKKIKLLPEEIKNIHAADDSTSDIIEIKNNKGDVELLARIIAADEESITIDRAVKNNITIADCTITITGAPWQPILTDDEIAEIQDKFADPGDEKDAIPHPIRYEYPSINYNAERMLVVFTVSATRRVTINGQPQYQPVSYMIVKKCDPWGRGDGTLDWVESDAPSERNVPRNAKSYPTLITGLPNLDKVIIYGSGSRGIFCAVEDPNGKWTTEIPFAELNASLDDISRARAWVEHDEKDTRYFNMIFSATKNGSSSLYYARYMSEIVNGKLTFTLQPLTIADIDVDGRMIDDLKETTPGNFVGNYSAWQDLRVIIDGVEEKVTLLPGQETFVYKGDNNLKIQVNPYRGTAKVLTGKVQDLIFTGYPSLQKLTDTPGADKMPTKILYGDDVAVSWIRSYPDWMGSRIYVGGWKLKRDPLFKNVVMRLEKNEINQQMVILSGLENDSDVVAADMPTSDGKKLRLFTIGWRGEKENPGRNDLFMSVVSIRD